MSVPDSSPTEFHRAARRPRLRRHRAGHLGVHARRARPGHRRRPRRHPARRRVPDLGVRHGDGPRRPAHSARRTPAAAAARAVRVPGRLRRRARRRGADPLLSGTTVALVAGVPAGALVGQAFGWRATFWVVAAMAAVALAGVVAGVPTGDGGRAPVPGLRAELTVLRRGAVIGALALGALVNGSTFAAYTYLAPLLAEAGGPPAVPVGLLLFGSGAAAGVGIAGRFADTRARPLLLGAGGALPVAWAALALVSTHPVAVLVLVGLLGALGFAVGSTLIARALTAAREAPTLGGAVATASLNAGATLGPLLGGTAFAAAGPIAPVRTAAALDLVAAPLLVLTTTPTPAPDRAATAAPTHPGAAPRRAPRR
nr:MFS transporter [Pseudonocardia sp. EV170527-09]